MKRYKALKALCIAAIGFTMGVLTKAWLDISMYERESLEEAEVFEEADKS